MLDTLSQGSILTLGSGVMQESLRRSRQKWMTEFIFEKYWTKPVKKKGVVNEDPKNPPKDSMAKLGQVTITIEPHVFDATLYAIKDPKAKASVPANSRPTLQYGPPKGSMPPPAARSSAAPSTPAAGSPAGKPAKPAESGSAPAANAKFQPISKSTEGQDPSRSDASSLPAGPKPGQSPAAAASPALSSNTTAHTGSATHPPPVTPMGRSSSSHGSSAAPSLQPVVPGPPPQKPPAQGAFAPKPAPRPTPPPPQGQANNAVIATLAERATSDDTLRDLMKKVADGKATKPELTRFQGIIDQIHEEQNKKNVQPAPPAEKLFVDGRSVKYFAEEVKTILHIVLASNPEQRSTNLRPPPGSDTLIVMLVQAALDDPKLKDAIHRIANGKPEYSDTLNLKSVLEGLHKKLLADKTKKEPKQGRPSPSPASNGAAGSPAPSTHQSQSSGQQALRSKGPPPAPKPDISAIAVEFAGGNGDRYLFPKFSVLEYRGSQHAVASFLIVRKSSQCEYGGDRELDYYEPITIRLFTSTGRHLENLARVVAPQEEVVRYMDDVMSNMTRAQYVLLAWRLMRERADEKGENAEEVNGGTDGGPNGSKDGDTAPAPAKLGVLWTTKGSNTPSASDDQQRSRVVEQEDEEMAQYQKLIRSTAARDVGA